MIQAQTTASFLRTGHLKFPAANEARRQLLLSQWGSQDAFNTAVKHIRNMGFSHLMAIEIALAFNKQCRGRKFGKSA